MAGIGFRLNKLLRSDDVYSKLTGALASILLSTGPWLCTILGIAAISLISEGQMDPLDRNVFRIIINYTYVASLVGFSFFEMVATRYIADAIYLRRERVIPTLYTWLTVSILVLSALIGVIFCMSAGLSWQITVVAIALLSAVSSVWCSMIFLSSCKEYVHISLSFVLGMGFAVGTSYMFGAIFNMGMLGFLAGFAVGQVATASALAYRIFHEFGTAFMPPRDFPSFCWRQRTFVFVGSFYALAIWVDKVVYWLSPGTSEEVAPLLFRSPAYDTGLFMAYLFVVPSMAYFMVQMETTFYVAYRRYFALIENHGPMRLIDEGRRELLDVVRQNVAGLVFFQGIITLLAVAFAPQIVAWIGLPKIYTTVFRYGLIGSTLHVFLMFANILILYFDLPKVVVRNYFIFFLSNGLFAYLTSQMDYRYHGMGYAFSALLTMVVTVLDLNRVVKDMNFVIFMKQPITRAPGAALALEEISLK